MNPGSKRTKVLVANRSEIACRIFQTCREMGLGTIAICAPGDEQARHLTYADEVHSVKGYLDIESVVSVARESGAKLIHPGYGFLSERPAFASAVEKSGHHFRGTSRGDDGSHGRQDRGQESRDGRRSPDAPLGDGDSWRGYCPSCEESRLSFAVESFRRRWRKRHASRGQGIRTHASRRERER